MISLSTVTLIRHIIHDYLMIAPFQIWLRRQTPCSECCIEHNFSIKELEPRGSLNVDNEKYYQVSVSHPMKVDILRDWSERPGLVQLMDFGVKPCQTPSRPARPRALRHFATSTMALPLREVLLVGLGGVGAICE